MRLQPQQVQSLLQAGIGRHGHTHTTNMKLLVLAALVAVCRNAQAVVPVGVAPYGLGYGGYGAPAYAAPLGYARPALAAPLGYAAPALAAPLGYARPALAAPLAYRPAIAGPVLAKVAAPVDDYDPNPQYSYAYDIQDAITGDSKNQQETRSGDVVQGSYSLVEPDGTRRIVEYTADPQNGFNAVVHKEPLGVKAVAAAPLVAKVAAPLAYPGLAYH